MLLSPRKKPTQDRARGTVRRIFEATERLVRTHGFANVGTRMIAEEAGVSVGSLYQYFPTYESILLAWYEDVATQASQRMRLATIEILQKPLGEGIRIAIGALFNALEKHSLVLLQMPAEVPEIERATASSSFMYLNRAAMRIFFGEHSEFDPRETERHIFFLETLIMSILRRWILERPRGISRATVLDQVCGLVEAYLRRNVVS